MVPSASDKIIVYCANGTRSILAAEALKKMGYTNVMYLEGGISGWKKARFSLVENRGNCW